MGLYLSTRSLPLLNGEIPCVSSDPDLPSKKFAKMSIPTTVDPANPAAQWASVTIHTAVGLGGLIAQAGFILDQLDIFHKARGEKFLGEWIMDRIPVITSMESACQNSSNEAW